ncbi:NUDIX domain-containing protein [Streptomyces sp. NPDC026666]|uniref:NUDIX hydrolase n=1 Tax=Streptomyces sp. NPDC026666 TaxID=3154799 RepID=UPI0034532F87
MELFEVRDLRLEETAPPVLSAADRADRDRVWEEAVRHNPTLFDGPVVAVTGLTREGPYGLRVSWTRTTYRHHALRRVRGATSWLPALFVSVVQPSTDGTVLVGRMASWTATPGRWQLPGGSVEPPPDGEDLDLTAVRGEAARELREETGITAPPESLSLCLATRSTSIGLIFKSRPLPPATLHTAHNSLAESHASGPHPPEFDEIALLRTPATSLPAGGTAYLEHVLNHHATR